MAHEQPQRLTILGATGSVGGSTLDLVARNPGRFTVTALTARRNAAALAAASRRVGAGLAVVADPAAYVELKEHLAGTGIEAAAGEAAVAEAARLDAEIVVAAIVGAAGLAPTLAAVEAGQTVALANKECLVCAGPLVMAAARRSGARILPVDSEHNAIFQVFERDNADQIEKVILTASGGPFRSASLDAMRQVTPQEALKHPNWTMGARITIDSATMMNKGFEVIEAFYLFPLAVDQLDVLVHPQSVVHGLVQYRDGSLLAQLGAPDMRTPIAHCLSWPRRMEVPAQRLDLAALAKLSFEAPDPVRFPALPLARWAMTKGAGATAALNAADEVMVEAFLAEKIGFLDIVDTVQAVLDRLDASGALGIPATIGDVMEIDGSARRLAREIGGI